MRNTVLVLVLFCLVTVAATQSSVLELAVKSYPDPTKTYPDSHLYVAIAKNVSNHQAYLPAAKLAGGYSGEGTHFPCTVEIKDRGIWMVAHEVRLQNVSGERDPIYARLEPGQNVEVCRALLPHDGGKRGALARFVLKRDWNTDAPRWVLSREFKID
jgi:hypothetical protein